MNLEEPASLQHQYWPSSSQARDYQHFSPPYCSSDSHAKIKESQVPHVAVTVVTLILTFCHERLSTCQPQYEPLCFQARLSRTSVFPTAAPIASAKINETPPSLHPVPAECAVTRKRKPCTLCGSSCIGGRVSPLLPSSGLLGSYIFFRHERHSTRQHQYWLPSFSKAELLALQCSLLQLL